MYTYNQNLITDYGNGCCVQQTQKIQMKPGSIAFDLKWAESLNTQLIMLDSYIEKINKKEDLNFSFDALNSYYRSLNDFKYKIYSFMQCKYYFKITQDMLLNNISTIMKNATEMVNTNYDNNCYFYPSEEEKLIIKNLNENYIKNVFTIKDYTFEDIQILNDNEIDGMFAQMKDQLFLMKIPQKWCSEPYYYGNKEYFEKMKLAIKLFQSEKKAEKVLKEANKLQQKNEYDPNTYQEPKSEFASKFIKFHINTESEVNKKKK